MIFFTTVMRYLLLGRNWGTGNWRLLPKVIWELMSELFQICGLFPEFIFLNICCLCSSVWQSWLLLSSRKEPILNHLILLCWIYSTSQSICSSNLCHVFLFLWCLCCLSLHNVCPFFNSPVKGEVPWFPLPLAPNQTGLLPPSFKLLQSSSTQLKPLIHIYSHIVFYFALWVCVHIFT